MAKYLKKNLLRDSVCDMKEDHSSFHGLTRLFDCFQNIKFVKMLIASNIQVNSFGHVF